MEKSFAPEQRPAPLRVMRIVSDEDREAVFRLRHAAYLAEGAIQPLLGGRLWDRFDEPETSLLFGVWRGDRLAASIRLHHVTGDHPDSPAREAFPDILDPMLEAGATVLDPNRFVADPALREAGLDLAITTLRVPFLAGDWFGVDYATATVRDEHRAFYRRILRCGPVAPARPYPTLLKPLGLMLVDYRAEAAAVIAARPVFAPSPGELQRLFGS